MPLSNQDRSTLEQAEFVRGKCTQVLEAVTRAAQIVDAKKNQVLFHQDDPATAFYIVLTGWVGIYRLGEDGNRADLGIFGPGESFAEAARTMPGYPANAQAMSNVRLARIDWRAIEESLQETPGLSLALADSIAGQLGRLVDKTSDRSLLTVSERLARYLFDKCRDERRPSSVRLPFAKALLARDLGVSPETLSRAFAELARSGVTIEHRNVHVHDRDALRQTSCSRSAR